jgi:hypothetical protein
MDDLELHVESLSLSEPEPMFDEVLAAENESDK